MAAKKEKKEKEPKPKAEPKKAEPKKEAPKKEAAVADAEADGLDMMEDKKKDPLDLLPKGSFDLEEWKRFYSNNDEEASCAWFWQHFDPQHYSIWRGEYRSGDKLLFKALMAIGKFFFINLLKGHGNEADYLGFLQKLVPHRSLTPPF